MNDPEAVLQAAQPIIDAAANMEKILSLEPRSDLAQQLEKLNGKTLAERKAQAEKTAGFLGRVANIPNSLTT